ncbi:16S rRNA (guanine(966)-N(2))-methyltransferase RsmD [Undibacterium flavidum]|uniref:16S rRNA (Guanine(966)-N(2))-methyltransferase RsmD n=1 Tax=Undibacterium flavidum TaxID=2762297 RepID=A0ABR6YAZ3_9BURK|nr:16S rRNA (guanine(966)-N(2))-methyltransferase RsmD [Undibacterium flavidum]MBC3873720.1 16S rRNA (guanine(966)-N(2))-methyltransferase RsmD [Undibacterium flavidum]
MNHNKNRQNPSPPPAPRANHRQASHQVRIIGGLWKRTPLTVISADGLRPTPDRVRETVFNWLHHLHNGQWNNISCLDMFAGSGALGFEAASRGASQVTMFEAFPPAYKQLEQTKQKLRAEQVHLLRGDALLLVKNLLVKQQKFDLIFLDPPFNLGFLEKILPLCTDLLTPTGILYVESEQALMLDSVPATAACEPTWRILRQDKAGSVYFHLLQRNTESGEAV